MLLVLIPGAPLVPILFLGQALNAVPLLPLLVLFGRMSRDPAIMGAHRSGRVGSILQALVTVALGFCVVALLVLTALPD